jgi:hypothetical protein
LKAELGRLTFQSMSTLGEIEAAIERLPASQVEKLALWLEQHRARKPAISVSEPDFLGRANTQGKPDAHHLTLGL